MGQALSFKRSRSRLIVLSPKRVYWQLCQAGGDGVLGKGLSILAAVKSLTKGVISLSPPGILYCFCWTTTDGTRRQVGEQFMPHSHFSLYGSP